MKITSEIFQVGGGGFSSAEDAAVYLIRFGGEAALVDAGCGGGRKRLLGNVRSAGVGAEEVRLLLLTHCHYDHTGGAAALRQELGCRIVAHELDAPFLEKGDSRVTAANWYGASMKPLPVDEKLKGAKDEILLGGRVIEALHTPGHTPGSVVFVTVSDGLKVLFGQDVHGPLDPSFRSDPDDYRRSLQLMLSLDADILCEGHYGVVRGKREVAGFIRQFLRG